VVLLFLTAATITLFLLREQLFGLDAPIRLGAAAALLLLGFGLARDLGRLLGPALFRRMDPGTAGTVGFLIRLFFATVATLAALRVAGLTNANLVPAAAATAVILGLAAQQTLGNLFAGVVLLSARPFVVGDRVRLQGGDLAGEMEGIVASLGLLHTVFSNGDDLIMVPNRTVLNVAIVPLREPAGVNLRARLRPGVTPLDIQHLLQETIETPTRGEPRILLEELHGDEVIVRIQATPERDSDGPAARERGPRRDRAGDPPPRGRPSERDEQHRRRRRVLRHRRRRRRLALGALRLAHLGGELGRPEPPRDDGGDPRCQPAERRARLQRERRDVDLRRVLLDRPHDRARDVLRLLRPEPARELGAGVVEHPRVADEAGVDDGRPDAGVEQVAAERQREPAQAELRAAVHRRAAVRRLRRQRRHEHELAAAALDHPRRERVGEDDRRAQVDVEHAVDLLDGVGVERPGPRERRVRDEHVHVAGLPGQPLDVRAVGEVDDHRLGADRLREQIERLALAPGQHEPRAARGEVAGDRLPEPAGRPGEEHAGTVE
jgi:small-conductance mechanosensitive channel